MNDKIKELALKCYNPYSNFDQDLFAKLIIEEVMKIMADPKNYNRCVHTSHDLDQAKCVVQELSQKIYEEFL
jgi:hypothetical protein